MFAVELMFGAEQKWQIKTIAIATARNPSNAGSRVSEGKDDLVFILWRTLNSVTFELQARRIKTKQETSKPTDARMPEAIAVQVAR